MRMKRKINLILISLLALVNISVAGLFDDRYPSPRFTAMGGAGVAVANDVWASYYNPAGLSRVDNPVMGTSYLRLFNVSFLKNFFGAAVYPLAGKYGAVSASMQYMGVNYKDESLSGEYTFAVSHGFYLLKDIHSSLSFGYSLKGYHWSLGQSLQEGDLGSATTMGVDVGFLASIYGRTWLGVYFLNINSPQIGAYTKHDLPQRVVVGLAYQPYDGVTTTIDMNRLIGIGETQIWAGAEFNVFRNLFLRFGGTTNPNRVSAGLGLALAQFKLDYAVLTHSELGETHQMGLSFEF